MHGQVLNGKMSCRWHYARPKASGKELLLVTKIAILIYTVMMGEPLCSLPAFYWTKFSHFPACKYREMRQVG